ncbi:MAG TPA: secretin N-terminal domain-containing protein [bacterium]
MRHARTFLHLIIAAVLIALVAIPTLGTTPAQGATSRVTQVTVKQFAGKTVIGIVATGRILYHMSELAPPPNPRVVVDLLDAVLDPSAQTTINVGKDAVLAVRTGQFQDSPPIARVVIDLVRPITVDLQQTSPNVLVVNVPTAPASAGVPQQTAAVPTGTGVAKVAQQPGQPAAPEIIQLLEFRGTALSDVLAALAKLCQFNIVTDGSVQGTITLRLVSVTCEEALRFILEANNLAFRRLGKNIIVSSAEKLAPPPEVPETIAYRLSFGDPNQIRAALAAAVPGIRVAFDPRTNALLVTGTSLQQDEVRKVLATLDIKIPQVVIQVHAVDISSTVLKDLGLFSGLTGIDPLTGNAGPFAGFVIDSAQNRISLSLFDNQLLLFRLRALVTESKARILSAPRIATLDGNKATILVGDKVPIFTVTTQAGVTTTTTTFQDVGVKLEVTPRVNTNNLMTVNLKPEVSRVVEIVSGPGGAQAPRVGTRSVDTTLTVPDGQTIVIGGLISQEERKTILKVPLLGDIPVIGELFRFTSTTTGESEVIFLITPQIMRD